MAPALAASPERFLQLSCGKLPEVVQVRNERRSNDGSGSPSKLAISNENLTKPATNSQLNTVAEQVNILVGCSKTHTRKLDSLVKILKAVAEKNGVSADILDDGPD